MLSWRESLIRRLSAYPRLAALSAALAWARADERDWLITELLELAVQPDAASAPRWRIFPHHAPANHSHLADSSLTELVRRWMHVSADLKPAALAVGRGRWARAVESVGQDASAARGIAALALETSDAALLPGLARLLETPGLQTAMYVERAMVELVRRATHIDPEMIVLAGARAGPGASHEAGHDASHINGEPTEPLDALTRHELERRIRDSIDSFANHRARGVIWCAMMLLDRSAAAHPTSTLAAWLRDKDQPSLPALRGVIRWSAKPLARLRAWEWLPIEHLATAAADRLTRAQTILEHDLLLSRHHLALRPGRAARMRSIGHRAAATNGRPAAPQLGLLPPPAIMEQLEPESRLGLPRITAHLRLGVEPTRAALEPLLADPDPAVRHAASRCISTRGLTDYCFDADPSIARSAMLSLSTVGVPEARRRSRQAAAEISRMQRRLTASPHAIVRAIAAQEVARLDWDDPASTAGRVEAWRMLAADPLGFAKLIRERWADSSTPSRARLTMLIRRLGLQADFKDELELFIRDGLVELSGATAEEAASSAADIDASSPTARGVATAIAALGEAGPHTDVLQLALTQGHGRIRANAVEALARNLRLASQQQDSPPAADTAHALVEYKDDAHHRVRANASRALIIGGSVKPADPSIAIEAEAFRVAGLDGLAGMLTDDRGSHRLAGVWLAGRILLQNGRARAGRRWPELASRVVEIARSDDDGAVRARAGAFAVRLQHQLKTGVVRRRSRRKQAPVEVAG